MKQKTRLKNLGVLAIVYEWLIYWYWPKKNIGRSVIIHVLYFSNLNKSKGYCGVMEKFSFFGKRSAMLL